MPAILYVLCGILIGVPVCGIVKAVVGTTKLAKKLHQVLMMLH